MLNIWDIFKKLQEDKNKKKEVQSDDKFWRNNADTELDNTGDNNPPKTARQENTGMNVSSAINKELNASNNDLVNGIYDEAISCAKDIYNSQLEYELNKLQVIGAVIEKIEDLLSNGNKELLKLCLTDYSNPQEYLYYHVVNVSIVSIEIGVGLEFERQRLVELGIAAFIHDIGIIKYLDIIDKNSVLKGDDLARIKEHPNSGLEILNKVGRQLSSNIFEVVRQEHERMDGSGYPQGLKDKQISEYARIVGLIDVYEAMIHQRPHRAKHTPLETIKEILANKNTFDCNIIKVLLERIGIFPLGTLVRLSTKEVGMVVKENPDLPLRPFVNVMIDSYGKQLQEAKQLNLADHSMIYIEECIKNY